MNYRKFYEKKCHIKIPKNYDIHHIDKNRDNNNIKNLVMLPKKLHKQYHSRLSMLESFSFDINEKITSVVEGGNGYNDWFLYELSERLSKFNEVYKECCKWNDYKYYLLGVLPNIHGIEVDDDGSIQST